MRKIIGGEYELMRNAEHSLLTDLGRSSLRIILKSMPIKVRYILPDFICDSVLRVFEDEKIDFDFYHVNEDCNIDIKSLRYVKKSDAVYFINYFGQRDAAVPWLLSKDVCVIEDGVFSPFVDAPKRARIWAGFNSLRKISYIADGSILKSTFHLSEGLLNMGEPPFSRLSYLSKWIKHDHIKKSLFPEKRYLDVSKKAKKIIDDQKMAYYPSKDSLLNMINFYSNIGTENIRRRENYNTLGKYLSRYGAKIKPIFYSYYPILTDERDALKEHLSKNNIFLPGFWPYRRGFRNKLYDDLVAVPVDGRYCAEDMKRIGKKIRGFLDNRR
jgi:hypothetical protein